MQRKYVRIENFPKELWISDARNFLNICGKIELVFHDDEEYHINGISNEINPCEGVRGTLEVMKTLTSYYDYVVS